MSFELKPLPYSCDALEPEIIEEIMCIHHDRHLKTYVNNLNQLLDPFDEFSDWSLEELIIHNNELPSHLREGVWNNAGGVYNHNLFFSIMAKNQQNNFFNSNNSYTNLECEFGMGRREIETAIINQFASLDHFKTAFTEMTKRMFGSGYTWLVSNRDGILSIINTRNQDTVLVYPVVPIILIDLWEHAYYLQYLNERDKYVENWFHLIDWNKANENYMTFKF